MADNRPSSTSSSELEAAPSGSPLKLLAHVLALIAMVGGLMGVILFVLPDGNDYAQATFVKHQRLDGVSGPKLVFVGGSNLAYGIDSEKLEHALGRHVVNMGMNAYFGLSYLLHEVEASLKPHDVVVISLEGEFFRAQGEFDPIDGRPEDLLMMVKTRKESASYVSWPMLGRVVGVIPEAVQRKTVRLMVDGLHGLMHHPKKLISSIETLSGFNVYGDLTSHIGVRWPDALDGGTQLTSFPFDPRVPAMVHEFSQRLAAHQVRVLMVPSPLPENYYRAQKPAVDEAERALAKDAPGVLIAHADRYVFPESCFFDDVHHLNGECRELRTARLIEELSTTLGRNTNTLSHSTHVN